MSRLTVEVSETASFLQQRLAPLPTTAVIMGTGLGDAVGSLDARIALEFKDIPNFPISTVAGHAGRLMVGRRKGQTVAFLQGRIHLYEGYTPIEVTFPVRVMHLLGVKQLILANAAGGFNPAFHEGDLMVIRDHINLTGENPLVGTNIDDWGPRFPDMTAAYDPWMSRLAHDAAGKCGLELVSGVYAGLKGPSLETPAEIRFLRAIGADAVGFSTVLETIAAVHAGMRVLGLSTITNTIDPNNPEPASFQAIVETAKQRVPDLRRLINRIIDRIAEGAWS